MTDSEMASPIRVCFISPKAYPLFNPGVKEVFGGAEVDLYFLATELAKDEDFAISFITADYGQDDVEIIDGVSVIKGLDFKKNPLSGAIRIWRAMRKTDADAYMLKTASPGTPLAAFFCLIYRKVFVYRAASSYDCDGTYLKEHFFLGKAFRWSLRKAGVVLTQSITDKKNLKETTGVSATVIANGHLLPPLSHQQREFILWVGRSADVKKPELFMALAESFPGENFTMICQRATGDDRYEELVSRAEQVGNLQFIRRVPFSKIDGYFQRAKVFVNTSDYEGFPNTFIQACKCATPVLSLNVNPDGFLDEYNCGICCDGDVDKLAEQLRILLAGEFREYGQNGRKYVQEHHDVRKIAERYKTLFEQLSRRAM